MKNKLVSTGLYTSSDNSNTATEIKSFAEGLDLLFDTLDEMTRECFITTAESYGITERERFLGKERSEFTTDKRRDMLIIQEQMMGNECSKGAFELMLQGVGLSDFEITENFAQQAVTVTINDTLTDELKQMVEQKINAEFPSHLDITINYSE